MLGKPGKKKKKKKKSFAVQLHILGNINYQAVGKGNSETNYPAIIN